MCQGDRATLLVAWLVKINCPPGVTPVGMLLISLAPSQRNGAPMKLAVSVTPLAMPPVRLFAWLLSQL